LQSQDLQSQELQSQELQCIGKRAAAMQGSNAMSADPEFMDVEPAERAKEP
jgi:hypothetical protein